MKIYQVLRVVISFFAETMRDAYLLALVFASNDEAVNSLAAEITEISHGYFGYLALDRRIKRSYKVIFSPP